MIAVNGPQYMHVAGLLAQRGADSLLDGLFDSGCDESSFNESACPNSSGSWKAGSADAHSARPAAQDRAWQGDKPSQANGRPSEAQRQWGGLCSRLLSVSEQAVSDEDLLALLLSYLKSAVDSRTLAMQLISRFETFGCVVSARSEQISGTAEVEPEIIEFLRVVRAAGTRLAREEISERPVLDAWDKLLTYLRTAMAHEAVEQFRVLFLDRRNVLIADEVQHRGTIDHTPVYPREIVKRALAYDASAIIMVHNHPSNHPAPSKADIEMTQLVRDAVEKLGIVLHDHIIVSRRGHTSFRAMGLLEPANRA
jgi:DNA repair protein RadC